MGVVDSMKSDGDGSLVSFLASWPSIDKGQHSVFVKFYTLNAGVVKNRER